MKPISNFCTTHMLMATAILMVSGCQTVGPNTYEGGLVGGATGSLIGAAVGATDGKPIEGAVIGGAVGSTLGATAGNQVDQQVERERQFQKTQHQQALQQAVSLDQVLKLTASGLDDQVIINQIRAAGVVQRPTADQLIFLKQNQVSDSVVAALQTAPMASQMPQPPVPSDRPYVYREHVFVEPGCCVVRPRRHPFYYGPRRRGVGVSFNF